MNPIKSRLQKISLSQIFIVSGLAIVLFFSPALGLLGTIQAQAKALTPEAAAYEIDSPNSPKTIGNNQQSRTQNKDEIETSQSNLKNAADNIREKLNLDEPLPEGTKDFINRLQGKETRPLEKN